MTRPTVALLLAAARTGPGRGRAVRGGGVRTIMDCEAFREFQTDPQCGTADDVRQEVGKHHESCRACREWLPQMIAERIRRRQEGREARDAQLDRERASRRAEHLAPDEE